MQIILEPAQIVNLDNVEIESVRDLFREKTIIARIKNVPKGIVLWKGSTEYAAASAWTNETAHARAVEVLALSSIPWVL